MKIARRLRVVADEETDMSTALKIAFATNDGTHVNQHFGSALSFALYSVDIEQATLLEIIQFEEYAQDGNEDKLQAKLDLLDGCAAVYCQAVGASAIRQLMMRGTQPVKVSEGCDIAGLITAFQEELREGPSSWLAKAIQRQQSPDGNRFDDMEAEGWQE